MKEELEIRMLLIKAIDSVFENAVFDGLCWYGDNQAERMAEAALQVLLATKEAQDYMRENDEKAI